MSNTVVQTNVLALNAHRNIGIVASRQARGSARLSSGFRINSAADDAAGLGISEKMRAQIRGLDQASRNTQDGISLIQTAEGAMSTINEMVTRIRELVIQAANDTNAHDVTNMPQSDRVRIQDEINQLMDEIDATRNRTQFNTRNLIDGSLGGAPVAGGGAGGSLIENDAAWANALVGVIDTSTTAGAAAAAALRDVIRSGDFDFGSLNSAAMTTLFAAGEDASVTSGGNATDARAALLNLSGFTSGSDLTALDTWLNSTAGAALLALDRDITIDEATALFAAGGALTAIGIAGTGTAGHEPDAFASVNEFRAWFNANREGLANIRAAGVLSAHTAAMFGGVVITGGAEDHAPTAINYWFETNFGPDAEHNLAGPPTEPEGPGNALWFQIGANHNQGIRLSIEDVGTSSLSAVGEAGRSVEGFEFWRLRTAQSTNVVHGINEDPQLGPRWDAAGGVIREDGQDINHFINAIDEALAHVTAERSKLGAMQNRLEYTMQNLDISSENLSASESRIRDADMALEMMRFTQANVLQQAAMSMLAQANQSPMSVLQLLN